MPADSTTQADAGAAAGLAGTHYGSWKVSALLAFQRPARKRLRRWRQGGRFDPDEG